MNTEQIIQEIEEHLNKGDIKSATKALYNHYEGFSDFDMCKEISGILYKQYKHWRSELIALLLEKIIRMNPNIAQVNFPDNFLFKLCITTGSMDMYECFIEEAVEPFLKDESEDVKWDYYAELSNIAHSLNDYFFPNYDRYEYGVDYKGAFAVYEKNSDFFIIEKDDYYAMEEVVETFNKIVGRRDVVAKLDEKLNEDLNEDNNRNFGNKLRMWNY